jgi:SulP family sulfate permease
MSSFAYSDTIWKDLLEELRPRKLFPSLAAAAVVTLMTVVLSVSFVALIFVRPITDFAGIGTSVMLFSATIVGLFMVICSSYPGTIGVPQDRVAPIMALMATLIIQQMPGRDPEVIGLTVLAAIAVTSISAGLILFLLGVYKLGNVVRFIPHPVIGGFMAGSGWLLLTGSIRVATGEPFSLFTLGTFLTSGAFFQWLPCVLFGVIAYTVVRTTRHFLALPAVLLLTVSTFYLWLLVTHCTLDQARNQNWILGHPPQAGFWQIHPLPLLLQADWSVILGQYSSIGAIILTSIVSILLNTSALELASEEDIDLNQELRAAGMANLAGGAAGNMVGFQSLSLSSLPLGMGVKSRMVGLLTAAACFLMLCFGTGLLGYVPRFILGGILFYNGLSFLAEWVFDAYFRLSREDYILVTLILGIVTVAGYLEGVDAGIIIATVLFVVKYSTVNVISYELSGDGHHSTVDRSPLESRLLETKGGQIYILRLKGFIFLGSANNLLNNVRDRVANPTLPQLRYIIFDFKQVSGLDSSGMVSFSKLSRLAKKEGFTILAASVSAELQNTFRNAHLIGDAPGFIRLFRDRDHAIEWCENQILTRELSTIDSDIKTLPEILKEAHAWKVDVRKVLDYVEQIDVEENHYLILQGDMADELYFIESGKVKVLIELDNGQTMRLRSMGSGTVVGELGFYLEQARVASVVTEDKCRIFRLTIESLRRMEREQPILASAFHEFMVRILAERVTQQNRTLRALLD